MSFAAFLFYTISCMKIFSDNLSNGRTVQIVDVLYVSKVAVITTISYSSGLMDDRRGFMGQEVGFV